MKPDVPTLLLVEADELLSDITAFRLELLGYSVTCVRSAKEARNRIARAPIPDLIIVDINLPDEPGLDFIRQLRDQEQTHNVPVMAFSLEAHADAAEQSHRAGASDFIALPYDPTVLEQRLELVLDKELAPMT